MKLNDLLYITLAAFYLVLGMLLGIVMGIRQDFQLSPVHAHINLVGFAAHGIFGLVYRAWPGLRQSALAVAQFWLFVLGAPVLMAGIAVAILTNNPAVAIVGSISVILGALLFFVIVLQGLLRPGSA